MLVVARKELTSLLSSPLIWIVFALMQFCLAYLFFSRLEAFLSVQAQLIQLTGAPGTTELVVAPTFAAAVIIMLIITPLLTMRSLAEELTNHTRPLVMSSPLSMTEIVFGKFFALMTILVALALVVTTTTLALLVGGALDFGLILSNFLGLILLCACFAAFGIYIATLTLQPLLAAAGTLGLMLGLWLLGVTATDPGHILNRISLIKRFDSFNAGILDSGDIVYCIVFILVFLSLAIYRLHRYRVYG